MSLGLGSGFGFGFVLRRVPAQPIDSRPFARQAGLYALHEAVILPRDSLELAPARAAVGAHPGRLGRERDGVVDHRHLVRGRFRIGLGLGVRVRFRVRVGVRVWG